MSSPTLVALDIDGTLIDLTGAGSRAINSALVEALDLSSDPPPITFAGRTDRAIIRDVFTTVRGAGPSEEELERFFDLYISHLPPEIARTPFHPTPFAAELLGMLRSNSVVRVGLATGNIKAASRLKLESAGLGWDFDFGAFGEETDDRAELVALAFKRGVASLTEPLGPKKYSMIVVGDTPHDIEAARAVGATEVAVATGPYTLEELEELAPDLAIPDLKDVRSRRFWSEIAPHRLRSSEH